MKKLLLSIFLFLASFMILANSNAFMFPLDSDLYYQMDLLYSLTGNGTPSNSRPWSLAEATLLLEKIQPQNLDEASLALYQAIEKELNKDLRWTKEDEYGFSAHLIISPELYMQTNNTDYVLSEHWLYNFSKRKPFLLGNLEMTAKDFFYTYCDLSYGYGRYGASKQQGGEETFTTVDAYLSTLSGNIDPHHVGTYLIDGVHFGTSAFPYNKKFLFNIPNSLLNFDYQWPKRAIFSLGSKNWNLSLSRDKLSWGNSHISNLVIDNHHVSQDYLRLGIFTKGFKYEFLTTFLEAEPKSFIEVEEIKIFIAHRLEFNPLSWLTFAISENVMYQTDEMIDLRSFLPANILHNLNNSIHYNAIAHAELNIQLCKGLSLYAQYALDQAKAPTESSAQTDAWGLLGGLEYTKALKNNIFNSTLEFAYTTPALYRRENVDFITMEKNYSHNYGHIVSFDYLGFVYGGDSIVLDWTNTLTQTQKFSLKLGLRGLLHGQMNMYTSHNKDGDNTGYSNIESKTPSGDLTTRMVNASLSAKLELSNLLNLKTPQTSLSFEIDYLYSDSYQKKTKTITDKKNNLQVIISTQITI